jgi:hypothetical protein
MFGEDDALEQFQGAFHAASPQTTNVACPGKAMASARAKAQAARRETKMPPKRPSLLATVQKPLFKRGNGHEETDRLGDETANSPQDRNGSAGLKRGHETTMSSCRDVGLALTDATDLRFATQSFDPDFGLPP